MTIKVLDHGGIERCLTAVGEQLAAAGETASIVIVGGAALNMIGVVSRTTRDVDVIARGESATTLIPPEPFPPALQSAVERVARDYQLSPNWMNGHVGAQWGTGLPAGFAERVEWRQLGALRVGLAGRLDLISLKLYAAADDVGPSSRHYQDLLALDPTPEELEFAAEWGRGQDASQGFRQSLEGALAHVRRKSR